MKVTVEQLQLIAGVKAPAANVLANMKSVVSSLALYGAARGLDKPHRLAQYLAQLAHESGGFKFDREIWGPTPAQQRYDTRKDLGNTPAVDGDGKLYAGRGPIQLTGKYNVTKFWEWCITEGLDPPDFTDHPDLINTDPWEGLSAIWYWTRGNPTGKSLNAYADTGDIEQITKKINGGLNGFADRLDRYTRAALVLLGRDPASIEEFQRWAQRHKFLPEGEDQIDGDVGPKTRAALHQALVALVPVTVAMPNVKAAPVTETVEVETTVVPEGAEKRVGLWGFSITGILAWVANFVADIPVQWKVVFGIIGVIAIGFVLFRGEVLVRKAKDIIREIEKP